MPLPHYFKWFLLEIKNLGPWGAVVFVALYAIVCLCFLPGSALTLAAGFMFGMFWGARRLRSGPRWRDRRLLIARTVGRRWFERRLATHPVFLRIDHAIGGQGFKIVLLTRLCSLLPYDLTSYAFGLIDVPLGRYVGCGDVARPTARDSGLGLHRLDSQEPARSGGRQRPVRNRTRDTAGRRRGGDDRRHGGIVPSRQKPCTK